ncbi:MAG: SlyX family protein [Halieaceae bacterium]|nr:SlyX family protein [Halieaceae bacterium]
MTEHDDDAAGQHARRIADLEAELAFQGDSINGLSDALALQQSDLLAMQQQLRHLSEQLRSLTVALADANAPGAAADERPPHY